jgi:hypothetical protein
VCHGVLFYFAARVLLNGSEVLYWRLLASAICAALLAGAVLEMGKRKTARVFNVAVPAVLGAVLISSVFWLEPEGAVYMLVFSLLPFFLACVLEFTYGLTNSRPDSGTAPL